MELRHGGYVTNRANPSSLYWVHTKPNSIMIWVIHPFPKNLLIRPSTPPVILHPSPFIKNTKNIQYGALRIEQIDNFVNSPIL